MNVTPARDQRDQYRSAFVQHCLRLLGRAFATLPHEGMSAKEEPAITGLLIRRANEILESDDIEAEFQHLIVLDDPPQNDLQELEGKRRPRIDVEFIRAQCGPRPRFHLEAKRLYRSDSVAEYWGDSGLAMFLSGGYASSTPDAGMVGYVQSDSCDKWGKALSDSLAKHPTELAVCDDRPIFTAAKWSIDGVPQIQESCHLRKGILGRIVVYHVLLDCCG